MKFRRLLTLGGITVGAIAAGFVVKSFLPEHFTTEAWQDEPLPPVDLSMLPAVEVSFLRCGSVTIPELIAVRGANPFASTVIAYSAVLIRHPRATFLYDTGFCANISTFVDGQPFIFRKTLGNFRFERSLSELLKAADVERGELAFALLSHLHWDHVSGIPDIPGVPLRVNRIEYVAAQSGLLDANRGLVRRLMGNNPLECFECRGPAYAGFRSSYDLFGDGSIVLVPLPGHTAGNTGIFINRSNGTRLFIIGDAAWVAQNYIRPATMHPMMWSAVTADDVTGRQTLIQLHHFAQRHPQIPVIAMHDAQMQERFTARSLPQQRKLRQLSRDDKGEKVP